MVLKRNAPEETLKDLYDQGTVEQAFARLLQLTTRIQRLMEARRSPNNPKSGMPKCAAHVPTMGPVRKLVDWSWYSKSGRRGELSW